MKDCCLKRVLIPIYEKLYDAAHNCVHWIRLRLCYRLHIMSASKTLKYIQSHHCSIARFGDGELSFALKINHEIAFQANSETLSHKLEQVLQNKNPNLLLCMPIYLNSLRGCTEKCRKYWWNWGKINNQQARIVSEIRRRSGSNYLFGDSLITRPYMDRQNIKYAERIFCQLQQLWDQKDLLIVEGEQTRLGIGNDLFSNANSIRRILAPAVDAFECYDQIKASVINHFSNQLVILALGPTATVLAADLTEHGIQALDLGHVDIEYEWFLQRQTTKTAVKGKYTNESTEGRNAGTCTDQEYMAEILDRITHQ